jgi:hypothetical protein
LQTRSSKKRDSKKKEKRPPEQQKKQYCKSSITAQSQVEWKSCIAGSTTYTMDAGMIPLPRSHVKQFGPFISVPELL